MEPQRGTAAVAGVALQEALVVPGVGPLLHRAVVDAILLQLPEVLRPRRVEPVAPGRQPPVVDEQRVRRRPRAHEVLRADADLLLQQPHVILPELRRQLQQVVQHPAVVDEVLCSVHRARPPRRWRLRLAVALERCYELGLQTEPRGPAEYTDTRTRARTQECMSSQRFPEDIQRHCSSTW